MTGPPLQKLTDQSSMAAGHQENIVKATRWMVAAYICYDMTELKGRRKEEGGSYMFFSGPESK